MSFYEAVHVSPLRLSSDYIRTVTVLPRQGTEAVECQTRDVALSVKHQYQVISYTEGPPDEPYSISLNGISFCIRKNLRDVLHHFRLPHRPRRRSSNRRLQLLYIVKNNFGLACLSCDNVREDVMVFLLNINRIFFARKRAPREWKSRCIRYTYQLIPRTELRDIERHIVVRSSYEVVEQTLPVALC